MDLWIFIEEEEEEAKNFKGAVIKFHKLFKLPPEEKLVNCKSHSYLLLSVGYIVNLPVSYTVSIPVNVYIVTYQYFHHFDEWRGQCLIILSHTLCNHVWARWESINFGISLDQSSQTTMPCFVLNQIVLKHFWQLLVYRLIVDMSDFVL